MISTAPKTTFNADLSDLASVRAAVTEMTTHVHRRLLISGRAPRTVTVKVCGGDFITRGRSETALAATTDVAVLVATAQRLVMAALPATGARLIGVSLSELTSAIQQSLSDEPTDLSRPCVEPPSPPPPRPPRPRDASTLHRPGQRGDGGRAGM
jgi:DNA polymerase-4